MWKLRLVWAGIGLGVLGLLGLTWWALTATLYSAPAFVERYFATIASDDIGAVMRISGVDLDEAALEAAEIDPTVSRGLLQSGAIAASPTNVRVASVETAGTRDSVELATAGEVLVTVSYELVGESHEATYRVAPSAPMWGVIPSWRFVESPLGVLNVTVAHGSLFTAGSHTLDTRASATGDELQAFTQTAQYLVVAPAVYQLSYDSTLLTAEPVTASALSAGMAAVSLDVQPTEAYVKKVQEELDEFLETCEDQHVLQPTGCPFGIVIDDRVVDEPEWTLVENPEVTLEAGDTAFVMPQTEGTVHLKMRVQDLYDGTISTIDRDETYTVGISTRVSSSGRISIQLE